MRSKVWFSRMPQRRLKHLFAGLFEFLRGKLGLEEVSGGAVELGNVFREFKLASWFHEFPERMDRRVRNMEHEPCDVPEDDALLLRHLGSEERSEHEVIEFKDRVGETLAVELGVLIEPLQVPHRTD